MSKKVRPKIDDSATRVQRTLQQAQAARAEDDGAAARRVWDALLRAEAHDYGVSSEEWDRLAGWERRRLLEDRGDEVKARAKGLSLQEYRDGLRGQIKSTGIWPQWYRDELAAQQPAEFVVEFARLVTEGQTATGERLRAAWKRADDRMGASWVYDRSGAPPFGEAESWLLQEIDRVGLREFFNEARDQFELGRILNL